jgi:hypothetical protein
MGDARIVVFLGLPGYEKSRTPPEKLKVWRSREDVRRSRRVSKPM